MEHWTLQQFCPYEIILYKLDVQTIDVIKCMFVHN